MTRGRRSLLLVLVSCIILFSFQIGNRDFWDPDEPRYAGVTRGILESGDWIRLKDAGESYTHKPPLFFWIMAVSARLGGGLNETTARLPSSAAAVLCVLGVAALGRRLFGARAGWLSAMVLATTQSFWVEARWVHMDTLLTLFILLSMTSAHRAMQGERFQWAWTWLWMALGCLTKGPLAVALPAAGLLVFLASCGELRRLAECGAWWGLPLAFAPAGIWLLIHARWAGFDALQVLQRQVLQRFQVGLHHPRPAYYYLISLPLELLPWTLLLPGAVAETFPLGGRGNRRNLLFLYGWILGGMALLSLAAEKRPSYLLPIFPPLALLMGAFLDAFLTRYDATPLRRWMEWPLLIGSFACVVGVAALPRLGHDFPGLVAHLAPEGLLLAAVLAGAWAFLRRRRRGAGILILLMGFSAVYVATVVFFVPWMNGYKSARTFSTRIASHAGASPLGVYRDPLPGVAYYAHRTLPEIQNPQALERFLEGPPRGFCILRKEDLPGLSARLSMSVLEEARVGHRVLLLVVAAGGE
jgi:4-amino-4-deoxy-L-arabinose transferase-like glycosyltransferase